MNKPHGVFDYVKSINNQSGMLEGEGEYSPFLVNRAFSYFMDTIFHANEANKLNNVPKESHYSFYYHSVSKGKRFSKWYKPEKDKYVDMIIERYDYSRSKAMAVIDMFDEEQLLKLEQQVNKGGRK